MLRQQNEWIEFKKIFPGDMCLGENTFQLSNVRVKRVRCRELYSPTGAVLAPVGNVYGCWENFCRACWIFWG